MPSFIKSGYEFLSVLFLTTLNVKNKFNIASDAKDKKATSTKEPERINAAAVATTETNWPITE